jgi:hypothetical protein
MVKIVQNEKMRELKQHIRVIDHKLDTMQEEIEVYMKFINEPENEKFDTFYDLTKSSCIKLLLEYRKMLKILERRKKLYSLYLKLKYSK